MTSKELKQDQLSSRPRSAVDSGRLGSQSLGRYLSNQTQSLDEKTVTTIWNGLGQYIAKQMRNGKGVSIPKFGNFTFSATQERDSQVRTPVFIVGKDFVSGVTLKAGIAHHGGAQLRPYDLKGASGIIPKVKINYTEVASYCGQSKDMCRNGCEQIYRFLSDKVRKGEVVQMEIPYVGQFLVRTSIAAVAFHDNLVEETKGVTAKGHLVNKLFANSVNRLNMQIHDQTSAKLNPTVGMGGAMRLTGDAESWLRSNLNISVQDLGRGDQHQRLQSAKPLSYQGGVLNRYGSMRPEDLKRKSWALKDGLTEQNKAMFDRQSDISTGQVAKRPMSAVTRGSRMTNVPDVAKMKLMIIANDIYKNRNAIADSLSQQKQSLRNIVSSSEIQQVLKKIGMYIEIGNLKALLRDLGFNWNGPSCSFFDLFQSCKTFLFGQSQEEERNPSNYFQSVASPKNFESLQVGGNSYNINKRPNADTTNRSNPEQLLQMVKDLFYSTRKSMYELFTEAKLANNVDFEGLKKVICNCTQAKVSDSEVQGLFQYISRGKESITYQEFEKAFKWDLPVGGDWETKAIRRIRDWMIGKGLSSDTAFELFCRSVGKMLQKRLTRTDFHKALNNEEDLSRFSAPEIDSLFNLLDANQDGELDIDEWRIRIYEDSMNPLQMLREIVATNNLTPDDLIFKMHLRYWDAPLDFPKFCEALRKLDPTLSEIQLRYLAKSLKNRENKVEITTLLRNLCGTEHETVDYRNKMFRKIYAEIHPHKIDELVQLFENADPLNDGKLEPQGLKSCLKKVLKTIDEDSIDRFIRFLDKDKSGKVNYMEFIARMSEVSNRDHNPFKSVVQRLAYFIETNKQSIHSLLKRLGSKKFEGENSFGTISQGGSSDSVSLEQFAAFLKAKIDKKRDMHQLRNFAYYMDIDKDGYISEIDLQTCLTNLNSEAFFKNSGEALAGSTFSSLKKFYPNQKGALNEERANEIMKQVRTALINKKIAYKEAFNRFDANKDGFLNFAEFSQGIDKVLTLSEPIKEKVFALMDKNQIGLVDYPNFLEIIQMSGAYKPGSIGYNDNFDWENQIIEQIKQWIWTSRITVEEAFKSFDRDFDGVINKEDLKWALINILQVKQEQILPTKLDRLFKLMDFYKTNQIQLSDFQRLINNENPYSASMGSRATVSSENFRRSFGGGLMQSNTFDWKVSAIQQIGLVLSKTFSSTKESFEQASEHLQKVTYDQFKKFVDSQNALKGFNMTGNLIQKIFSEIDPHKKGYLTESDWNNAFQSFNWNEQAFIEIKNLIQCAFADCDSAFEFFLTFKQKGQEEKKVLSYYEFEKAVESLSANRFKRSDVQNLWKYITDNGRVHTVDKFQFRTHFDNLKYQGNSLVRPLKSAPPGARTTIYTQSSSSSTWNEDIFEKLRQIIRSSAASFEDIFKQFDEDKNGYISQVEFRNALRKLNLAVTSREIDKLIAKIDTNADGKIDWKEFIAKFKTNDLDERLKERAKDKMARVKELMILHMNSPNDAFRYFDQSKLGKLTYQEFSKLIIKLNDLAGDKPPPYPVIKDIFDTIDIRKDGIIDMNEWQQTFGNVLEGNNKVNIFKLQKLQLSIKATPLAMWENSREFGILGNAIAKNRKNLRENFEKILGGKGKNVTFAQAKQGMDEMINLHFKGLSDEKIRCLLRVSEVEGSSAMAEPFYDYMKFLDVYKQRHAGPQL